MSWPDRSVVLDGDKDEVHEVEVELPLDSFIDGGWYWFDVLAFPGNDVMIESADWSAETNLDRRGRLSIGITTFNRPDYCVEQLRTLGTHDELFGLLDRVYLVDQGDDRVQDQPDFEEVAKALGAKLQVIEQGNLGGSGGFARAMHETLQADESDYLLLLDDDVILEPEGILRAATFADLAHEPVLVGGHMFSIFARSVLHAWGEAIDMYRWMWGPAPNTQYGHDFAAVPLAHAPWLHRRVDVDYNGWWMCLIPIATLRKIGLSLPMFIKWDDADYGLRASEHGFPTVSLPGVAVWHVPWHEKDDRIDWQAYFHERNRLLSALIHSPYKRGGRLPRESFEVVLKHALAMQYSPAEMVLQAIEDLLEGPQHMHRDILTKITELRALRGQFDDSRYAPKLRAYPPVRSNAPRRGHLPTKPLNRQAATMLALREIPRHFRPVPQRALDNPEYALPHADQKWWRLAQFDSVLVSAADGSGAAWLRRDPERFRSIFKRSTILHARLTREWEPTGQHLPAGRARAVQRGSVGGHVRPIRGGRIALEGAVSTRRAEVIRVTDTATITPAVETQLPAVGKHRLQEPGGRGGLIEVIRSRTIVQMIVRRDVRLVIGPRRSGICGRSSNPCCSSACTTSSSGSCSGSHVAWTTSRSMSSPVSACCTSSTRH